MNDSLKELLVMVKNSILVVREENMFIQIGHWYYKILILMCLALLCIG